MPERGRALTREQVEEIVAGRAWTSYVEDIAELARSHELLREALERAQPYVLEALYAHPEQRETKEDDVLIRAVLFGVRLDDGDHHE